MEIYDRDGEPISVETWSLLHRDLEYKRVAETTIGPYWISTVWLGMNHNWGGQGPPLIFETMVFQESGEALDIWMDRYATAEEAKTGHEDICTLIRATVQETLPELESKPENSDSQ